MKEYKKILTFSFDDGVTQDIRLIELFDRYGLKSTFNLNSELLGKPGELCYDVGRVDHSKVNPADVKSIYAGHEVAVHTLTHPLLPAIEEDQEIVRQVEQDRLNLSELVGYEVLGMAYPCGGINNDERVAALIRANTGVQYARTLTSTFSFTPPQGDLLRFDPTCHFLRAEPDAATLANRFLNGEGDGLQLFYVWGHSYELDLWHKWEEFEEFCRFVANRDDVLYLTNLEAFRYAGLL